MSQALTVEKAESLVKLMTDGLVNIVDETGEFLLKREFGRGFTQRDLYPTVEDGTIIDTKGWQGWEWTHGIALTALMHVSLLEGARRQLTTQHSAISPIPESAEYSLKTAISWFESQYALTKGKGAPKNINTMSPFYMLSRALLDGKVKDQRWLDWCDEWAEWVMNDLPRTEEGGFQHSELSLCGPRYPLTTAVTYAEVNKNQMWDDTLMMTVLPLAQIGILLNRPHYVQEAKYQFLLHIQYLADPVTGLWYHGWEFTPTPGTSTAAQEDGFPGHHFAKALWARGNCWITVAIPVFLEVLGEKYLSLDDPIRRLLVSVFRRQVDALVKCQDKSTGLWHTLLVDPSSYVETSATAGFAAGMFAGVRMVCGFLSLGPEHLIAGHQLTSCRACYPDHTWLQQPPGSTASWQTSRQTGKSLKSRSEQVWDATSSFMSRFPSRRCRMDRLWQCSPLSNGRGWSWVPKYEDCG
jgi:unsaturated rhamnogalacturonyl hydrolase